MSLLTGKDIQLFAKVEQIHKVTSGNIDKGNIGKEFDSGFLSEGRSFQHTFNSIGIGKVNVS